MNKTVLIVDDDPIVRLVIQKMIHNLDSSVNCLQCDNGVEGLEILERLKNVTDAIALLLDINMPFFKRMGIFRQFAKNKPWTFT